MTLSIEAYQALKMVAEQGSDCNGDKTFKKHADDLLDMGLISVQEVIPNVSGGKSYFMPQITASGVDYLQQNEDPVA